MKALLFLSALLFVPGQTSTNRTAETSENITRNSANHPMTNKSTPTFNDITSYTSSGLQSTPVAITSRATSRAKSRAPTVATTTSSTFTANFQSYKLQCPTLLMVSGILILICTIFLISILTLLWKVCQLSRRLKTLSNSDLINMSESWMGTAESNKNKPETEAKESTMLMADSSQTQDETNNGTIKEAGEKAKEDEQTREEKEVGDTANSEEASTAPVTAAESSSSSKPEEEATDPQPNKAVEAASSESKEEPDVEKK